MPDTTVTEQGYEIAEHVRDDGETTMVARINGEPVWVACKLLVPIGVYHWQVFPFIRRDLNALVLNKDAARAWLEHEAAHALLAAKVVAA